METIGLLLLSFVVFIDKGMSCSVSRPQCFKSSTLRSEDFLCEWEDTERSQGAIYTLFLRNVDINCSTYATHFEAVGILYKKLPLESLLATCLLNIWVRKEVDNMTCNSSTTVVVLKNSVKYSPPSIKNIIRKAGLLTLRWPRPNDDEDAIHEIRWKKINGLWHNDIFVTKDNISEGMNKNEVYKLQLEKHTAYQVQVRRKAKNSVLWSDWSKTSDIPIKIEKPVVQWKEKNQINGTRKIILSWNQPPLEASFGGVTYELTLDLPCTKKKINTSSNTSEISVTFSEASVSIVAVNNVGKSSSHQLIIPPVKHLTNCHTDTLPQTPKNSYCLEWYMLRDGETRPANVNTSKDAELKTIKNSMEKYVRYYYFLHIGRKKDHLRTKFMCPIYSMEGEPDGQPQNVTVSNMTHDSAVLSWRPIPVQDQRGFLTSYKIWISRKDKTNTTYYEVPANKTSFLLENLVEGSSYIVHIAGQTKKGAGRNFTMEFTFPADNGSLNKIILIVCGVLLLLSFAISVAIRRIRRKLLPVIPSPVISASDVLLDNQNTRTMTEDVDNFVLLSRTDQDKNSQNKHITLLHDCEDCFDEDEEEEDEETHLTELGFIGQSNFYPNPNYKGQVLKLTEPVEVAFKSEVESCEVSTTSYKSGLFFENRQCENGVLENEGTLVQL